MKELALTINGTSIVGGAGVPTGGQETLERILNLGLNLMVLGAIILCLSYLIWGGFNWMTSENDKQKLSQAQQKIVFAIIGLIVVFLSFLIINIIKYFFGISGPIDTGAFRGK